MVSENGKRGVYVSGAMLLAAAVAAAGVVTTYVFATKGELVDARHDIEAKASTEGVRTTVLEGTVGYHDRAIGELRQDVKAVVNAIQAVDMNVRTMMVDQGFKSREIAKPKPVE